MKPNETCQPERIAALLSGEMSVDEQSKLEAHIETCNVCQSTLADSASGIGDWSAAARHLKDDEHDGATSVVTAPAKQRPRSAGLSQIDIDHAVEIRSTDSATAVVIRQIIGWLDPTDDPRMLGRLGGYEIAGVIGSGGMGVVLKGFDASLNRFVAIKLLAPHLAGNGASRQRFAREAQAAAAVVHENVIAIHSVAESNDLPYLVMPYVRGMSLQKRVDVEGPLELEEILRIGMQTASGLAAAHAQGLVHRDIKPANILLADGVSRVTITDFGLARAADDASLTHSGLIAGTPQYMSPEQASGANVDHRSDLYSLGSMMYAMCAGRPPFRAESAYGILKRIAEENARPIQEVNPKVPAWLAIIITKLHARHPENRFRSATEVERLLSDCLAHVQQPTRVPLPREIRQLKSNDGSFRWGWVAASLLGAAIIGVGGYWGTLNSQVDPVASDSGDPSASAASTVAAADHEYSMPMAESSGLASEDFASDVGGFEFAPPDDTTEFAPTRSPLIISDNFFESPITDDLSAKTIESELNTLNFELEILDAELNNEPASEAEYKVPTPDDLKPVEQPNYQTPDTPQPPAAMEMLFQGEIDE